MVKVQIPFDDDDEDQNALGKSDADNEEVGIMSSSEMESDVDDEIGDPDWDDIKNNDADEGELIKSIQMRSLPQNGVTIQLGPPRVRSRRKKGNKGASNSCDEDDLEELNDKPVKKKKRFDINECIRKRVNKVIITEQLMKHKMSLLLYLARGLQLVKVVNNDIIRGLSLSVTENRVKIKGKKLNDLQWLQQFVKRFGEIVGIYLEDDKRQEHMEQPFMLNMLDCYRTLEVTTLMEFVVMFVACLKSVRPDFPARIVNVLRPISLIAEIIPKPPSPTEPEETTNKITEQGSNEFDFTMFDKKKNKKAKAKKDEAIKIDGKDEGTVEKLDFWLEVYIESEGRWVCVDLCNSEVDEPSVLIELSQPINYLVSYDVDRICIKAAEKNYCRNWYTAGFKRNRCEDNWWNSLLSAMGPSKPNETDRADETKNEEIIISNGMPTSDNGFRRHPIYVLKRHLLKYEVIYPPDVPPLGFFKDEPIYPRDCVRTCRSRDTWNREARTVLDDESPYKIVTSRPKYDKTTGNWIKDLPLELFGDWQTKDYEPPVAENGIVPRNRYGNVDMYKECMLPKGCVWLKLHNLHRVANKLGIDCVAAVTGFDNSPGSYGAHPTMEGYIVCEEFAETLQLAWEEEQENIRLKEEAKREKRIWDNWKRLIKAALIRERLRVKYKNS